MNEAYDPKTVKFPYTKITDQHYLIVKKNDGTVFDEDFPYIDHSKSYNRKRTWFRLFIKAIVIPVVYVRLGLRIKGREIIKKNKDLLKNGVISICNHIHLWDYLCIMHGIRPFVSNVVVWAPNLRGENKTIIRLVGGIPVPDSSFKATMAFNEAIGDYLSKGGWLHIYPEGSMWEYYKPIRPFKKGFAYYAIKYDKPVMPLAISYRKPSWIRRKIFHQEATFTLNIGEPIFRNKELDRNEQEIDLMKRCHEAVSILSGSDPKDNIYPPIFNNNERVDYYTDTYGVGYKGSH